MMPVSIQMTTGGKGRDQGFESNSPAEGQPSREQSHGNDGPVAQSGCHWLQAWYLRFRSSP